MKGPCIRTFAAALAMSLAAPSLLAQERAKPSADPHSGTKEMGTTGETGGSRGQTKQGVGSRAITSSEALEAADQPEMATGLDLKGPPVRFPPAKTPE